MRAKLTKRLIESTATPKAEKLDVFLWDTEVKGFGCRVTAKGGRVYVIQARVNGRLRRYRLGRHGALTVEQARILAKTMLADIAAGGDPITAIRAERSTGKGAPTIKELADRYLDEHARVHKKPRSVEEDERNLKLHITPALGALRVADVTRQDVAKLHHRLREMPIGANRVLALLSKMFNLAEQWSLRPDGSNPCRHIQKYKEQKRERFLSELELARLGKRLAKVEADESELPSVVPAIRLLLLSGARLSEILTLRWEHIDEERRCIRLPDSKTGAKVIPLNAPALDVLAGIARDGSPWVIRGGRDGRRLINLEAPWRRIREEAKLNDVRLHDLRHSFASVGAAANLSLPVIGALLGHREAATTKRYAHLADDPLQAASEQISGRIRDLLATDPSQLEKTAR